MKSQKENLPKKSQRSKLDILRDQIDKTDANILEAVSKRFLIVKKVADYKKLKNLPIVDLKRKQAMISKNVAIGLSLGLNEKFVKKLYELIHEFAVESENESIKDDKTL